LALTATRAFAAVDLGADSGRVVLGRLGEGSVSLEVVYRLANRPLRLPDGLHWNLLGFNVLPADIVAAILFFCSPRRAGKRTGNILNVGSGVALASPR
jgi:hypothetical protein